MAAFEVFQAVLDPEGRLDYTVPVNVNTDEHIATAIVEFVNETSTGAPTGATPSIDTYSFGTIREGQDGITAWISGNGVAPGFYYIRFRGETDSSPTRKFDKTLRLRVAQT